MSKPEDDGDGFLSGWSRRKLAAKRQQHAPPPAPEEPAALPEEPTAQDAQIMPEEAEDAEQIAALPSLDEITAGFDIKPFLAKGVPARLKNAAMRKLWLASPSVRDYVDPAMDYAWDWNAPGGVPGGGGILSEQSVAKMVKDLIGGGEKRDVQAGEEAAQDNAAPDYDGAEGSAPVDDSEGAEIPDVAPEPVRLTAKAAPPDTASPHEVTQREASAPAPRRHGGAAPE